ncbi:hypothetical protein W97_05530 [Coniosporium apollinis CBS 100218]|uniref:Uncharacterized protein n=1 Tax=Coniosporium apollinis (strain CBS 100218) TaxID=1168221 RepID=R7YX63_CONA1|nr:uncharacterized protein W97_05530 [Coniosporium apollinis CBS 100218]EON66433.1 hypothetical protein W97_05530 [Coniosporium apollinis CBS 100218]
MSKHTGDSESQMSEATRAPEVTRMPEDGSATSDTDKEPHMTTSQYLKYYEEMRSKYGKGDDDCFKMARRLLRRADLPAWFKAGCHKLLARGDYKPVHHAEEYLRLAIEKADSTDKTNSIYAVKDKVRVESARNMLQETRERVARKEQALKEEQEGGSASKQPEADEEERQTIS